MKKNTYLLLLLTLKFGVTLAQVSFIESHYITKEEYAQGNTEILTKTSTMIDGILIENKTMSLIKRGIRDKVLLIKITHVFRSQNLNIGDTIILLLPSVSSFSGFVENNDSIYEKFEHGGYPRVFHQLDHDFNYYCELFLTESSHPVVIDEPRWRNKKVYELYPTKYGYASVYFKDNRSLHSEYDVHALFDLKFKTKQEWYKYLDKYDNIKNLEDVIATGHRIKVPQAFYPDGENRFTKYFYPQTDSVANYSFQIINPQNAAVIYTVEKESWVIEGWNGTLHNDGQTKLPQGAYNWKYKITFTNGKNWQQEGTVMLVRD